MACTPAASFAWTGFILANIGLATLTTWGILSQWVLGISICFAYSILLFILSYVSEKKYLNSSSEGETTKLNFKVFVHLLYALAVLTLATSGLILSLNVFNCVTVNTVLENNGWEVNISSVPEEVQSWAKNYNFKEHVDTTFKYFPESGVALFRGNDGISEVGFSGFTSNKLWRSINGHQPVSIDDMYDPFWFVRSETSNITCFIASERLSIVQKEMWVETEDLKRVVCTDDGLSLRIIDKTLIRDPFHLFWNNDVLWIVGKSQQRGDWGNLIFSINPISLEATIHSAKRQNAIVEESSCDNDTFRRKRAIATLFISSLPLAILSLILWIKKGIPTLPITTYVGLSASAVCIQIAADYLDYGVFDSAFYRWWFGTTSAFWVSSLFFLFLVKRIKPETLAWSLNFSSIVLLINSVAIFGIFRFRMGDDWWRWVLINIFVFIPLIMVGIICKRTIVVLTGSAGLFMDVYKISDSFTRINDYQNTVPIYFGVCAVSGIVLGVVGWILNKKQESLQERSSLFAAKYLSSFMIISDDTEIGEGIPLEVGFRESITEDSSEVKGV